MKFLVDNSISPAVAAGLRDVGHDAIHVGELGIGAADDDTIVSRALAEDRNIVTCDWSPLPEHFRRETKPSVVRFDIDVPPTEQHGILTRNLVKMEPNLVRGCLAMFLEEKHLLYLWLPLDKGSEQNGE